MKPDRTLKGKLAIAALPALLAASAFASAAPHRVPEAVTLQTEIERLAQPIGGKVGVAAWRLDGHGLHVRVNADEAFPMASVFKVAVAGALLAKVDAGTLTLDQLLPVEPAQYVESELIAEALIHPGIRLSIHNLLELMLTRSDNTATDVLTATAGGPDAVTAWLRKQGVPGQRVDRDTAGLLRDFFDLPAGTFSEALAAARKADPKLDERALSPKPSFDEDPRDTSTPAAMAELLTRIFSGGALSPRSTSVLIETMQRCHTGDNRLRARLPAGTVVADKTGTLGGSVNDVGVITLPGGKGDIVVAVFTKKSNVPFATRERLIADIGRAVYDFYLLEPVR